MRSLRSSETAMIATSVSQPNTMTGHCGRAHGDDGAQRSQSHGPPTSVGTIPCVTDRTNRSNVIDRSSVQRR